MNILGVILLVKICLRLKSLEFIYYNKMTTITLNSYEAVIYPEDDNLIKRNISKS